MEVDEEVEFSREVETAADDAATDTISTLPNSIAPVSEQPVASNSTSPQVSLSFLLAKLDLASFFGNEFHAVGSDVLEAYDNSQINAPHPLFDAIAHGSDFLI